MSNARGDMRLASLLAVFQFTARGVPVTYYGEEIGMSQLSLPKRQWKDPVGKRFSWVPGFIPKLLKIHPTRDSSRSPMQWEAVENAGFSPPGVEPWLPVNTNFRQVNAATQKSQPDSLLNTYRQLLKIRASNPALHSGQLELISQEGNSKQLLAYKRSHENQVILVIMNFSGKSISTRQPAKSDQILFKSGEINPGEDGEIYLGPYASALFRI
jgi:oligo-1,6-glucosidase/alpha-glucosidase